MSPRDKETMNKKMRNYRTGVVKRRLGVQKGEQTLTGSLISRMNTEKRTALLGDI